MTAATAGDLNNSGVLDLTCDDQPAIGSGWSYSEGTWRWAVGVTSELRFRLRRPLAGRVEAVFEAASIAQVGDLLRCVIELNETVVFVGDLRPDWRSYAFSFDSALLLQLNFMRLTFANAAYTEFDPRLMTAQFRTIAFTEASSAAAAPIVSARDAVETSGK